MDIQATQIAPVCAPLPTAVIEQRASLERQELVVAALANLAGLAPLAAPALLNSIEVWTALLVPRMPMVHTLTVSLPRSHPLWNPHVPLCQIATAMPFR